MSQPRKIVRFLIAVIKYFIWGNPVSYETYVNRLNKCNTCPYRIDNKCGKCGCFLKKKANWSTESCPLKKW